MTSVSQRVPAVFVNHGGGALPLFGKDEMTKESLRKIAARIAPHLAASSGEPTAIVAISAHWATETPTCTSCASPSMLYDYPDKHPPVAYEFDYAAPGSPALASRIAGLIEAAGLGPCALDAERGLDHGVFVPLMIAYPAGTIPVVTLSISASMDAATHLAIGAALRPLRDEGILLLGSGLSFHNMRALRLRVGKGASIGAGPRFLPIGREFDNALVAACTDSNPAARNAALAQWTDFPGARDAHPRGGEEHLMPLFVIAGAAGDDCAVAVDRYAMMHAARVSNFVFGGVASSVDA